MKKFLAFLLLPLCCLFCACTSVNGEEEDEVKTGTFYTVTEAYDKGYLTLEDVKSIAYYHNGGTKYNEEIMGTDYTPSPKTPETLSDKAQNSIKQTFLEVYWTEERIAKYEALHDKKIEVSITEYDGTYGSCVAVMLSDNCSYFFDMEHEELIDNVKIYYNNSNIIHIWVV